jgi:hypothetical protein
MHLFAHFKKPYYLCGVNSNNSLGGSPVGRGLLNQLSFLWVYFQSVHFTASEKIGTECACFCYMFEIGRAHV